MDFKKLKKGSEELPFLNGNLNLELTKV